MQVDLRPLGAFGGQFFQFFPIFLFEVNQDALDVLAGADKVVLVIGTGAGVVQFVERADFDAVGFLGNRTDFENAENGMVALVDDFENLGAGALAAAFDLFLDVGSHGKTPKPKG